MSCIVPKIKQNDLSRMWDNDICQEIKCSTSYDTWNKQIFDNYNKLFKLTYTNIEHNYTNDVRMECSDVMDCTMTKWVTPKLALK